MAHNDSLQFGGDLMIFIGASGTTTGTTLPIAFSTSSKLSISTKTRDISSKDSGYWSDILSGTMAWTCSTDGLVAYVTTGTTTSFDALFTKMVARTPVQIFFAVRTGTSPSWTVDNTKKYFSGLAIITALDMTAANNDNTTFSISLDGSGALTMV